MAMSYAGKANDLLKLYGTEDSNYKAYMAQVLADAYDEEKEGEGKPFRKELRRLEAAGFVPELD